MANLAVAHEQVVDYNNVIQFDPSKRNKKNEEPMPKRPNNKVAGKDSEVYAFRTKEEIAAMIAVYDRHIEDAENDNQRQIACRNKMLFVIGINVGIRGSDLRELRWSFFFDKQDDGTLKFKDFYKFMPKKTSKQRKYVKINFNEAVKKAVYNYIEDYPIEDLNDYVFASRVGDESVTVGCIRKILKSAAAEAGIEQNIGSHSLRKTFGRHLYENAVDKTNALVLLQTIMNHSSPVITARYIGITDDDIKNAFNDLNLGIDMI